MYPRAKLTSSLQAINPLLLSGTNQFLGKWVPSLCPQRNQLRERRKGKRGSRSREHLLTHSPERARIQPKTSPFCFLQVICLRFHKEPMAPEPKYPEICQARGSHWRSQCLRGGRQNYPGKHCPLLFYSLIFEDHTVPFIFSSGCLWFECRNPNAFKRKLPVALIELIRTHTHTRAHTHRPLPSQTPLTTRHPTQLTPFFQRN